MFSTFPRMLLVILMLLFSQSVWAERTDVVYLHNGDRITGEVKSLFRGKLEFKTDHMGTLLIEWDDIMEIVSDTGQVIELTNGQRFYGPLAKSENTDMVMVDTAQGQVGVNTLDVIAMYPVEAGFWDRLDLSASLGFNWDKGSDVLQRRKQWTVRREPSLAPATISSRKARGSRRISEISSTMINWVLI